MNREKISAVVSNWKTAKNAEQYFPLLRAAELKYSIPSDLLSRMAYQESHFRDDIVNGTRKSTAGAVGIMQIIPRFHPSIDPGDAAADERAARNPAKAIDYAGKYLRQLYNQFHSWQLAVAAYNAGPGNVQKHGGIPPFVETQQYVVSVFRDLQNAVPEAQRSMYA